MKPEPTPDKSAKEIETPLKTIDLKERAFYPGTIEKDFTKNQYEYRSSKKLAEIAMQLGKQTLVFAPSRNELQKQLNEVRSALSEAKATIADLQKVISSREKRDPANAVSYALTLRKIEELTNPKIMLLAALRSSEPEALLLTLLRDKQIDIAHSSIQAEQLQLLTLMVSAGWLTFEKGVFNLTEMGLTYIGPMFEDQTHASSPSEGLGQKDNKN